MLVNQPSLAAKEHAAMYMNFAVCLKLTRRCWSAVFQNKMKEKVKKNKQTCCSVGNVCVGHVCSEWEALLPTLQGWENNTFKIIFRPC